MSSVPDQPDDLTHDELPAALARDLRVLNEHTVRVPAAMDAAILQEARAGFARRRRFRLAIRGALIASGAAAAAAIVLAVRVSGPDPGGAQGQMAQRPAHVEDVDHSGKVDILDAYVVARLVDLQDHLDNQAYDVNGDGKIDRADVDRIAMAAVDTTSRRPDDGRVQ